MQRQRIAFVLILAVLSKAAAAASDHANTQHHEHAAVETSAAMASERYEAFIADLSDSNVAIINVMGMVCDFCARGIEKTFKKDRSVRKIDVDLANGQVLIAYGTEKVIDEVEITEKILANGQNVTAVTVVNI